MSGTFNIDQININITDVIPPENFATITKNGKPGNTYSIEEDNEWRKEVENTVKSGIIGVLKPNTPYDAVNYPFPKPWAQGDSDLYEKYDINEPGNFPSAKDANGDPLEVFPQDLENSEVQIWIKNGVAEVVKKTLPQASVNIRRWEGLQPSDLPLQGGSQVIFNDSIWKVADNKTVSSTDLPGVSPAWLPFKNENELKFTTGYFLVGTGELSPAGWMKTSNYVMFEDNDYGTNYTLSRKADINYRSIFFFDENFDFISSANTQIVERPLNAKYYRISHEESEIIDFHKLPKYEIVVTQNFTDSVNYDFTDLQKATDYADSLGYPCLIKVIGEIILTSTFVNNQQHVFEGVAPWFSVIKFISNQELMQTTISTFRNIKFRREGVTEGYCLHPDYAGEGVVEFDNCEIENTMGACIGSGSHSNQTLRLKNTTLKSISNGQHLSPCLYWHNNVGNVTGQQRLEMLNVTIYSDYERPIQIADQNLNLGDGLNRTSWILAINVRLYGALYGLDNMLIAQPPGIGPKTVAGNIKLDPLSGGNNLAIMNY